MSSASAIDVLLVRDMPDERRISMERFADGLEQHLADREGILVHSLALRASRLGDLRRLARADSYTTRFARYPLAVRRCSPDVYHVVDQGYAHALALVDRRRALVTCHDLMLLAAEEGTAGFQGRRSSVIRFRWSVSYLRSVARVATPSDATKDDVIRLLGVPEERVVVIPNGVAAAFRPLDAQGRASVRRALGVGADTEIVLHVSSGHPYKNASATIETVAALRAAGRNTLLVRIGQPLDGEEAALVESMRVSDAVVEIGAVSDDRLVEFYNGSDLLLFPSHREGFGWPVLEAMACGTPVVTSACPALSALVDDAGIVVDSDDARSYADAVASILDDPEKASELRARGLRRARAYSWEATVDAYLGVYEEIASATRRAAP